RVGNRRLGDPIAGRLVLEGFQPRLELAAAGNRQNRAGRKRAGKPEDRRQPSHARKRHGHTPERRTVAGSALRGCNIGKKAWRGRPPPIKALTHKSLPFQGRVPSVSEAGGVQAVGTRASPTRPASPATPGSSPGQALPQRGRDRKIVQRKGYAAATLVRKRST